MCIPFFVSTSVCAFVYLHVAAQTQRVMQKRQRKQWLRCIAARAAAAAAAAAQVADVAELLAGCLLLALTLPQEVAALLA
jgi:hypothetical protein